MRPTVFVSVFLSLITAFTLNGCAHKSVSSSSIAARDRAISASVPIDNTHQLALTVKMGREPVATPGLTPLEITVRDADARFVDEAIVYVQVSSATGETPALTVVASKDRNAYRVNLPLVYGSHWSFEVKAYSNGRHSTLSVEEQLD